MSDQTKHEGSLLSNFIHRHAWGLTFAFVFMVSAVTGYCAHFKLVRPLINDEALELIQGVGMPLDKFYFFTPDSVYPMGTADIIETFCPYIVRFAVDAGGEFGPQTSSVFLLRGFYAACYLMGCVAFAWAAGKLWGAGWAAGAGLALASSPFVLVINNILTRNGISILWVCLIVAALVWWTRRDAKQSVVSTYTPALVVAGLLILGCWTYTAFRLVAIAVYAALVVDWWYFEKTKARAIKVMVSGILFGAVLLVLMAWNSDSLLIILRRGGYAVGDSSGYLARLALTLATPFNHPGNRVTPFIIEDVHALVGGAVLSKWLAVFFVVGWLAAWVGSCRVAFMAAVIWTTGMLLCAVAGPNFKYLLPFMPFALLLAISGLRMCVQYLASRFECGRVLMACVVLIFSGVAWSGLNDFFGRFPADPQNEGNRVSNVMADVAVEMVKGGAPRVYVQPGRGVDIVFWRIKPLIDSGRVAVYSTLPRLLDGFGETAPVPPGSVLLIDYPIQQFRNSILNWDTFPAIKIINTRELKDERAGEAGL
ncbi:hypothetical protein [Rariglobus hedericola]|uniref:Glycosyltransferase RgtA/B/C/D-like domain-containing protein n=1 Tax=Rariglobus hedericola TaxID=2597822 RepID=A0A556QNH9_9BACT|nr:hypothetical protein [Rariglobus hedericola]TSJ78195.1 hypothetical protein FPL22_02485 [Rariglobus hedericola]